MPAIRDEADPDCIQRLHKEITMKNVIKTALGSMLALSLTTAAFAGTGFKTIGAANNYAISTSNSYYRLNKTIPAFQDMTMLVDIASFGLGAIGEDLASGNLRVTSVKAPAGIGVLLIGANTRANSDQLKFYVSLNAGTPKGVHAVQVSIENKLTGDNGVVNLTVNVR